jgi:NDP-sugar pyrophosphorylase family protein
MSRIRHALILAAGRGLRMAPLTDLLPKPMAPLGGSTLIAQGIARLAKRIPNIHVTVGYKGAMLAKHVVEHGASSVFNTEGKGNSWWIYNTLLSVLREPIYVLTCDNVVDLDLDRLETDYVSLGAPPCMVVPVKPIPGLTGDFIHHDNGMVRRLSRTDESDIYCSGMQVLNPAQIKASTNEADSFYGVWDQLISQRSLCVSSVYPSQWFAVDTVDQLRQLNDLGSGSGPRSNI